MGTFDNYQEFNPANSLGRRTLMKTTSSTWTTETAAAWFYDQRGRVVSESRMIAGSGTFLTQWGYNSGDMLSWIKYPGDNLGGSGEQVNYTYLPQGALLQVTNATKYALNMQYDAAGRLTSITRGVDILNTAYAYYPWDIQGGRLKTIKTGTSIPVTPTLQSFEYDYDPNGNIDWIKDYLAAGGIQTQTFHYDELNRLKDAQASGGTDGTYAQQVYNYDNSTGNLSSKAGVSYTYNTQVSCAAGSRTIPHAASAMGSNEYSYDCNGNMEYRDIDNVGAYTLVYDAENRLVSMTGTSLNASFVYNGDGERVKATVNGTTTAYVGNYYEWSNNSWTKYYYAGTTRLAMRTSSSLYFLLGDHLGSTSIVATSTGVKYSESRYMPWGEDRHTSTTPPPTAYLYTGQKFQSGLGLYFYNARFYDPELARFITPDSIVPEATQGTQAWDRYAYTNNNPVRYNDPSGHGTECGMGDPTCNIAGLRRSIQSGIRASKRNSQSTQSSQSTYPLPDIGLTPKPYWFPPKPTPTEHYPKIIGVTPTAPPYSTPAAQPPFEININWDKVDKIDLAIDVIGIVGDIGAIGSALFGQLELAIPFEGVSAAVELVGFGKSIYEATQGDPSSMLLDMSSQEVDFLLAVRFSRVFPGVGIAFNGISIALNLAQARDD